MALQGFWGIINCLNLRQPWLSSEEGISRDFLFGLRLKFDNQAGIGDYIEGVAMSATRRAGLS